MSVEIRVPNVGESITEVTLSRWLVEEGDYIEIDQEICELESDKATLELPSSEAGTIEFVADEGDDLEIDALLCKIDTSADVPAKKEEVIKKDDEPKDSTKEPAPEAVIQKEGTHYASGHASPAANKLLKESGLNAEDIKGSGRDGRITSQDVREEIKNRAQKPEKKGAVQSGPPKILKPDLPFSREIRREKMSRLRRTIADKLVSAKNETAMLTTFNEVNMEPIMQIRKKYKEIFKEKFGVGLGFMSFFTKAICHALKEFPSVNAILDGKEIQFHDYCDISIAVSTPRGLIVPVIRNADSLTMNEIEAKVADLAGRGRENQLDLDEMTGGTFTITNGGVFGSLLSTPIINTPQSAILGMHKIEERPVAENGQVVIKPMMYVALSYDHRIVDGKESVSFLVLVKEYLENPHNLLQGGDPVKLLLQL